MVWGEHPKTLDGVVREIRFSLVTAVQDAHNARTQRDRAKNFAQAYAYASTLDMLRRVMESWPEGIANDHRFYGGQVKQTLEFLNGDDNRLLGVSNGAD